MPFFYHLNMVHKLRETRASTPPAGDSFEASARYIGCPQKDLMDMLARELKEELEERDQPKTGATKGMWLRRRLHAARSCARMPHLAEP